MVADLEMIVLAALVLPLQMSAVPVLPRGGVTVVANREMPMPSAPKLASPRGIAPFLLRRAVVAVRETLLPSTLKLLLEMGAVPFLLRAAVMVVANREECQL